MKRILVTGGFGFLGSHLLEILLADPETRVHVIDNLSTSPLPLDYLLDTLGRPERLTYDIVSVERFFSEGLAKERFDRIYHLASVVGPAGVLQHAGRISSSIIRDAALIMDYALETGAKMVDISTSEVYGGGRDGYCREDMAQIIQPEVTIRLEYAVGKLASEVSLINFTKVTPFDCSIVRPFNISGPRQSGKGGFVLPRMAGQALSGRPLTVFNEGLQIRAFTHVKDVAEGAVLVMEKGERGGVYNIGYSQNKITIRDLAERVVKLADSSSRIEFIDPKTIYGEHYAEANDKFPDDTKAVKELGWKPKYSMDDIIADTIEFMRSLPDDLFEQIRG
ncbi:MAG: NAD-dependent epimerase/dehydratase family protein [bacterium]|nr:NAD-dependent epimerase/dehydratase family protein [bacterium]